jgi:hypothetical protein
VACERNGRNLDHSGHELDIDECKNKIGAPYHNESCEVRNR